MNGFVAPLCHMLVISNSQALPSNFQVQPASLSFSPFSSTTLSMFALYASMALAYLESDVDRIRMANKAAFVEFPIPTVATGTPRWEMG